MTDTIWQQQQITISTHGRGCYEITQTIQKHLSNLAQTIDIGLCHIWIKHTSASLMVNENADATVLEDIEYFMKKMVIDGDANYRHNYEGDDDMSAHIRHMLTQTELSIPIKQSNLVLGTWQGIYLYEHRYDAKNRCLVITINGSLGA